MCWTYHPDTAIDYLKRGNASFVWKRLELDKLVILEGNPVLFFSHTVDGRNPSPPGMYKTL